MTEAASQFALAYFAVFSRFAGCLMLMPGFSSQRVAMRIRLWITIALTLALGPLIYPAVEQAAAGRSAIGIATLIISETFIGIASSSASAWAG